MTKKRQDEIQLDSIPDVTIKTLKAVCDNTFPQRIQYLQYTEDLTDMFIYLELLLAPAELVLMEKPSVKIYLSKHALHNHTTSHTLKSQTHTHTQAHTHFFLCLLLNSK